MDQQRTTARRRDRRMTLLAQMSYKPECPESYVDPDQAAAFLKTNRLQVIRMARSGCLPAYPLGAERGASGGSNFPNWTSICREG